MDMGPAVTPKFTSSALTPLIAVKIRKTYEVRGPVASLPRTAAEAPWMLETQQLQELRHVGNWIGLLAEEGRGELQTPLLESATSAVPAPSFLQTLLHKLLITNSVSLAHSVLTSATPSHHHH